MATGSPARQVIASGGMAGWQITLIALGAALFASVIAVLADRSWRPAASTPAPVPEDSPGRFIGMPHLAVACEVRHPLFAADCVMG